MSVHAEQQALDAALVEYGIQTERSDIRAHVSVVNQTIYVFQTRVGQALVQRGGYPVRQAFQEGVCGATGEGWIVPVGDISDLRRLRFESWCGWAQFKPALNTSAKGNLAVTCVISAMKLGRFPIWFDAVEDEREQVQIQGTDLLVFCRKRIQVKCDYYGGDRPKGSGNLFLQRAERNPRRLR